LKIAYLILENGTVFKGQPFGYDGEAIGELVFSTGMTGYLETLSDPAYFGQIVLQTFPLIGNYGVIPQDFDSGQAHLKAYIVREWCQEPSNFRSEGNLDSFLSEHRVPGLFGIDTRALTRALRVNGVINAMISRTAELSDDQWAALRGYRITGAVAAVCASQESHARPGSVADHTGSLGQEQRSSKKIAIWDFGGAYRLAEPLISRGCKPEIIRYDSAADDIIAQNPDGIVLSGGPGDPSENIAIIQEIKKVCDHNIPIFAVGLGHQMLALARGAVTIKLPFGNRGSNQPVREFATGRVFVTTQNHGYAVDSGSLPDSSEISHENLNDRTCEGIAYKDIPAFSVQFFPTEDVFDRFVAFIN